MTFFNNKIPVLIDQWVKAVSSEQQLKFKGQTTEVERYKYISELIKTAALPQHTLFLDKPLKSNASSQTIREAGNLQYKTLNFVQALQLYNKSVAFAEQNSPALALALGNRAACLLTQGKIAEALVDVQRALQISTIDGQYAEKLAKRQDVCINRIIESQPMEDIKNLPKLASTNAFFDSACEHVVLAEDKSMGRYLKANGTIRTGQVLIIEKPYASVLIAGSFYTHCSLCLVKAPALVECPNCTTAMYCSTMCLKSHEEEHSLECRAVEAMANSEFHRVMDVLAVRILARTLCQGIDVEELMKKQADISATSYSSADVRKIYDLVGNSESRSIHDLLKRIFTSYVIIQALVKFTPAFTKFSISEHTAGGFIFHLLQNLPCNAHEVTEVRNGELFEVGGAAYATLSLLNHSCDPNVVRQSVGDVAVLRAIRPISSGEELVDNYGCHYATHSLSERQSSLKGQYLFTCGCLPCTENWPLYHSLPDTNPKFKTSQAQDVESFQKRTAEFEVVLEKVLDNKFSMKIISWLCEFLDFLDRTVERPWQDYNKCQEAIKHALNSYPQYSTK